MAHNPDSRRKYRRPSAAYGYGTSEETPNNNPGIQNITDAFTKAAVPRDLRYTINFDAIKEYTFVSENRQESCLKVNPSAVFGDVFKAIIELNTCLIEIKRQQENVLKKMEEISTEHKKIQETFSSRQTSDKEILNRLEAMENNLRCLRHSILMDPGE